MKYVPSHRFEVSEAIKHKRRFMKSKAKQPCLAYRMYQYADSCFHACYLDFYGVLRRSVLIMGEDHLLNLICAYALASRGISVIVVDDKVGNDDRIRDRYTMRFPGLEQLVCDALRIELCPTGQLEHHLSHRIAALLDADGDHLVRQLANCTLAHEASEESHCFWAESISHPTHDLGLPQISFWDRSKLDVFGTETGKCPQFRAEFNTVILTSASQYSRLNVTQIPSILVGDALTPLERFEYFRGSDRLREILDAIKVVSNVQDIPLTDQHHQGLQP